MTKQTTKNERIWLFALLIIIAASVPFVFSLGGRFVFDDQAMIVADKTIHSLSNIPKAFTHGLGAGTHYYRPFVSVSYIVNYAMFGENPVGYKVTNLLLHVLCALLVFFFARHILKGRSAPLLAALVFAVHPAHTENVAWISGRMDLLATAFALMSILAFYKYDGLGKRGWYIASLGLFLGALLSKESVIVLPALILILMIVRDPRPGIKKAIAEIIPFTIIAILFFFVRQQILGQPFAGGNVTPPLIQRLLSAPAALLYYCRILVLPAQAQPLHDLFKPSLWHPAIIVGTWASAIVLFAAAVGLRRRFTVLSFSILWVIISLLPALHIIPLPWMAICERFLYLPSVGFSLLFGLAGGWIISQRPRLLQNIWPMAAGLGFAGLLIYCAMQSYAGAALWSNNKALASRMVECGPRLSEVRMYAGETYYNVGEIDRAIEEYQTIIDHIPRDVEARRRLVVLYTNIKDFESVAQVARVLVKLAPDDPAVHNDLGVALTQIGDLPGAVRAFKQAIQLAPTNPTIQFNYAHVLYRNKEYKKAVEHYRVGLKLKPENGFAGYELGLALQKDGKTDEARKELRAVAEHGGKYASKARAALDVLMETR